MKQALLVGLLVGFTMLSGCTEEVTEQPEFPVDEGPGMILEEGLTAESVVAAPQWTVGDYFGHHIYFGDEDVEGTHIDAVVVEDQGNSWLLAPDDPEAAKWESTWDFPMMGLIGKSDLETTGFSGDWNLYDFPLEDGKTWTSEFNPLFAGSRELTMTATFSDSIQTERQGTQEGFTIEGVNEDGEVELLTDYIPAIGWYSELTYFQPITADTEDFILRVYAMGQGSNWEGTYIMANSNEVVNWSPCWAPLNQDGTPNAQCTVVATNIRFEVTEGVAELYGAYFLGALAGNSRIDLIDPSPFDHDREVTSTAMDDFASDFGFYNIVDPVPGTWNYQWSGTGFVAVGYTQLWEIQYNEFELTA